MTVAGWLVYGVASSTNESGISYTNIAANAVALISGGGNIVDLDTDTGLITTTLPNGTQILSSSVGDDNTYMYSAYFVWTIPVGGTINANFAVGEAATAWAGQANPISAGSSSASGVQLLSGGATIIGWGFELTRAKPPREYEKDLDPASWPIFGCIEGRDLRGVHAALCGKSRFEANSTFVIRLSFDI